VAGKGIEKELGNPSFTPAVVASLQVAEVCKLLLGKGELLRRRKLCVDLLDMEMHEIRYEEAPEEVWFPVSDLEQERIAGYRLPTSGC
jgi:molybdopterin/thiamine biosynthesis adenylyltransferase